MKSPTVKVSREWLVARMKSLDAIKDRLRAECEQINRECHLIELTIREHDLAQSSRFTRKAKKAIKKGGKQ